MSIKIRKFNFTTSEKVFIFLWTFYSVFYFLFSVSELTYSYDFRSLEAFIGYATIILQILAIIFIGRFTVRKLVTYLIFIALIFLIELSISERTFLIYALFIILAQEINFDKLIRYDLFLKLGLLIVILALCLFGVVDNYTSVINGTYKQSLGFGHPNTLTCYVLTMLLEYLCVRYKKMKWLEWILVAAIWFVIYMVGGGKASAYTFILIFILFIVATVVPQIFYTRVAKVIFAIITPLMAALSFLSVWLYVQGTAFGIALNSLLSGRIRLAAEFLAQYGIKLFGQEITLVGTRIAGNTGEARAILDPAYIRCAVYWGGVILILILILNSILFLKLIKYKRIDLILLSLFFVIMGFGEAYLLNVMYNLSFLCLLNSDEFCVNVEEKIVPHVRERKPDSQIIENYDGFR